MVRVLVQAMAVASGSAGLPLKQPRVFGKMSFNSVYTSVTFEEHIGLKEYILKFIFITTKSVGYFVEKLELPWA